MNMRINQTVLMSGPEYFSVQALNVYSQTGAQPDLQGAVREHQAIRQALKQAGVAVVAVPAPPGCQDGVFTANWALCRDDVAVVASLPPGRTDEESYAAQQLRQLGKRVIKAPYHFSGQGDALPCGNRLFAGSGYRTDLRMHAFLADALGYDVISLQTVPARDNTGEPLINRITGWPDSFFYDIDLALAILTPALIAWCPEAFTPESQQKVRTLPIERIEVSLEEATRHFACNLLSTGETVVMGDQAPRLQAAIEAHGLRVMPLSIRELAKGGGFIRCTALTLS
jgi:N-dimethylarginine dimethylaminohydrolase